MIEFLRRTWFPVACFFLGLLVGWLLLSGLVPVHVGGGGARPADLAPAYLQDYLALVADSYAQTRNLAVAKLRLEGIDPAAVQRNLTELAQQSQQLNLTTQAQNTRGLAAALQQNPGAAATAAPIATALAARTPAPAPTTTVILVSEPSFVSRLGSALMPVGAILFLLLLAAAIFWLLRRSGLLGRLRLRRGAGAAAGTPAEESASPPVRRPTLRPGAPSYIPLNAPTEMRYAAETANFRQDLRIVDAGRHGIGEVGLHVSEIPPRDPTTGAPSGLELSLFDSIDRRTRKIILVSADAAADPANIDMVNRLENDWYKPAVNVQAAQHQPITLETAYLRLTAEILESDFRPGALNPTFRILRLSVTVTPKPAGSAPPPVDEEEEEEDDMSDATSVVTPPPRAS